MTTYLTDKKGYGFCPCSCHDGGHIFCSCFGPCCPQPYVTRMQLRLLPPVPTREETQKRAAEQMDAAAKAFAWVREHVVKPYTQSLARDIVSVQPMTGSGKALAFIIQQLDEAGPDAKLVMTTRKNGK